MTVLILHLHARTLSFFRNYGESVEKSLRELGFKVDLMFPKPEVLGKLNVLMEALAANGAIFAVVIRPENQDRQSVTVHVLRGVKIECTTLFIMLIS